MNSASKSWQTLTCVFMLGLGGGGGRRLRKGKESGGERREKGENGKGDTYLGTEREEGTY